MDSTAIISAESVSEMRLSIWEVVGAWRLLVFPRRALISNLFFFVLDRNFYLLLIND